MNSYLVVCFISGDRPLSCSSTELHSDRFWLESSSFGPSSFYLTFSMVLVVGP